jgi:hypothetical protein
VHLAGQFGLRDDDSYQDAYWKAFQEFFGPNNAPIVKAMLLERNERVDTGDGELDRVCFGLRETMSWLAEALERKALKSVGKDASKAPPPRPGSRARKGKGTS